MDWHVPAKFAGRGYEVLSPLGEVIKVVPRQLSDSELNDKDLVERLKRGAEAERACSGIDFCCSVIAPWKTLMRRGIVH